MDPMLLDWDQVKAGYSLQALDSGSKPGCFGLRVRSSSLSFSSVLVSAVHFALPSIGKVQVIWLQNTITRLNDMPQIGPAAGNDKCL